ncbi:hypothetical protein C7212DRAFT_304367, partial [Tuber magnatum]
MGKELIEKRWEIRLEWIPGHVGLEENEEADEWAQVGCFKKEEEERGNVLSWRKWEQRRKE